MLNISRSMKVELIVQGFNQYFGFRPRVLETTDHTTIAFTPAQQVQLQQWIEGQLKAEPGEIRFALAPVLMPLILKKALPFLAGSAGIGFVVGKVT